MKVVEKNAGPRLIKTRKNSTVIRNTSVATEYEELENIIAF